MQHSRRKGTCSNDQRRTRKPVWGQPHRGFESHSLRHAHDFRLVPTPFQRVSLVDGTCRPHRYLHCYRRIHLGRDRFIRCWGRRSGSARGYRPFGRLLSRVDKAPPLFGS